MSSSGSGGMSFAEALWASTLSQSSMTTSEKATQKAMTNLRRSVHHTSSCSTTSSADLIGTCLEPLRHSATTRGLAPRVGILHQRYCLVGAVRKQFCAKSHLGALVACHSLYK